MASGIRLVLAADPQLSLQGGLSPVDHTEAQPESMQSYTNLLLAPGDVFVRVRPLLSCSHPSPRGYRQKPAMLQQLR